MPGMRRIRLLLSASFSGCVRSLAGQGDRRVTVEAAALFCFLRTVSADFKKLPFSGTAFCVISLKVEKEISGGASMGLGLAGKVALVTGGSRGIGATAAKRLAARRL